MQNNMLKNEIIKNLTMQIQQKKIKELSIWGIDNISDELLNNEIFKKIKINFYIDSNPQGRTFNKRRVITPKEALERGEKIFLILSLKNKILMANQLHQIDSSANIIFYNKTLQIKNELLKNPINPSLHIKLAEEAINDNNIFLANAEIKTAEFLNFEKNEILEYKKEVKNKLPKDLTELSHNEYFRIVSLVNKIKEIEEEPCSILDVGGGTGLLASFLPDNYAYVLAEPKVNGISGLELPFSNLTFDYVVACHVLEHIPFNERANFLNNLLSKAKKGLVLLNPFYVNNTYVEERLKLSIEITDSEASKEHLKYTLPKIEDIKDYAENHNLNITITPNGTLTTSMLFVYLNFFLGKAQETNELKKINKFFNEKYFNIVNSDKYPTAYLITLLKK